MQVVWLDPQLEAIAEAVEYEWWRVRSHALCFWLKEPEYEAWEILMALQSIECYNCGSEVPHV